MCIKEWIRQCMGYGGGYMSYAEKELGDDVTYEMGSVEYPEQAHRVLNGAGEFLIRCLANPKCEGSEEVLRAIMERREHLRGGQGSKEGGP